jgi:hypothetical protein
MGYGIYGGYFSEYVATILKKYKTWQPLYLTTLIGFDGSTASERTTCFTPQVDSDAILFGGHTNFSNAQVNLKISDTGSGYVWNVLQGATSATTSGTPVTAIAGASTQVMPILAMVCPYFLSRQSKLQMDFTNSATSVAGATSSITWVGIKLLNN